jgi:superfamily II DNA or RNA helicase
MIELFPHQIPIRDQLIEWGNSCDHENVNTLVAVMSAGKTACTTSAIESLVNSGKRVWVIVHRAELIDQWTKEFYRFTNLKEVSIGYLADGYKKNYTRPVTIVQVQTLAQRLKRVPEGLLPDVVFCDEAHETAFFDVMKRVRTSHKYKQINLTATPARHGKSKVQYADVFTKEHWLVAATAKEMIAAGRWKKPHWITGSEALAEATAQRFSGIKECGGEYEETAQAAVMLDLLDNHLAEVLPRNGQRSAIWFVVNTAHGLAVYDKLIATGAVCAFISGDEKITVTNAVLPGKDEPRKEIIEAAKTGQIQHLINIKTCTTGTDVPIISSVVWLVRSLSINIWCQGNGRGFRYHPDFDDCLVFDMAGNLAVHPFPEEIDWEEFDPCMRMFRDPTETICHSCGYVHHVLPRPIGNPGDRWLTGQACFVDKAGDGREISLSSNLHCHNCGNPVYGNLQQMSEYGAWLTDIKRAGASGKKPPKFKGYTVGCSIGAPTDGKNVLLTLDMMYETGVWRLTVPSEREAGEPEVRDRSEEYRELQIKLMANVDSHELKMLRFSMLTWEQQQYYLTKLDRVSNLMKITDNAKRYRAAIAYAYLRDYPPTWAYRYYGNDGIPDESDVVQALKSLWGGSVERYQLLLQWFDQQIEKTDCHATKGICGKFRSTLVQMHL